MTLARRRFLQAMAASPLFAQGPALRIAVNRTTIESAPLLVQTIPGVEIVLVANGREASAQLVAGKVDAATGSETQLVLNSVAQPNLRVILTLAHCYYRVVARRSAGITNFAALREKRIAATPGTSSLYFLTRALERTGLRIGDVTVVDMEGPNMPKALAEGRIDAMAMWEPHAQIAIDTLGPNAAVLDNGSYTERFNLNTTATVLADPAKRVQLIELTRRVRAISPQLARYRAELSRIIDTPEPVIMRAWSRFDFVGLLSPRFVDFLSPEERWAAGVARRSVRNRTELVRLVDSSIFDAAK